MSLVFNLVGGGDGELLPTDAILRVQAPAGSTVTITKGTTTKTDLGHESADDHTVYDYYFIIHQSQFDSVNPWTVTATLSTDSSSNTIIIDAADEYDMILDYGTLYDAGKYSAMYSHTFLHSNATVTDAATYVQVSQSGNGFYGYVRWENVDLTNVSRIVYTGKAYDPSSSANGVYCYIFATQNSGVTLGKNATVKARSDTAGSSYKAFSVSIDVSSLTGLWYVAAGADTDGNAWGGSRKTQIESVILER